MPLIGTTEMFKKAYEGHYAIGAFNINNMEIVQGVTQAAAELNSPIILQASAGARKYAKPPYLKHLVEAALEDHDLPIAFTDHGADCETCKDCIDGGFTSVMIDGSKHSFEDNIALTKKVVEYAHAHGVVVEGETGQLAGSTKTMSKSLPTKLTTRVRKKSKNSYPARASTPWPSLSAPATALPNSPRNSARATLTASSYRRHSASTSSKKSPNACRASRSSSTAHLRSYRNTSRSSTKTAATWLTLSASRKTSSAKQLPWLSARSTSTPTSVSA